MDPKLTVEKRLDLLEAENRSLKLQVMKAENNAETGIALGIVANIAISIITGLVIMISANSGILNTNFNQNAAILAGMFLVGFVLPLWTLQTAYKKIKENK